jgi:hypothetical protein
MTNEKRTEIFTFRMTGGIAEIVEILQRKHGSKNRSDYFRGLVFLDAHLSGEDTSGLDRPGWLTRSFPQLLHPPSVTAKSLKDDIAKSLETDLEVSRAHAGRKPREKRKAG